jgi:DNA-binding NarL/FixJ family response regulator
LTAQEATIARMLVEGLTERQIAAEVCVGTVALRAHLAHICAKLDVPGPGHLASVVGCGTMLEFARNRSHETFSGAAPVSPAQLTPQERAVDRLLRHGVGERQVAAELSIGVATVRLHIAHIQEKLGSEEPTGC